MKFYNGKSAANILDDFEKVCYEGSEDHDLLAFNPTDFMIYIDKTCPHRDDDFDERLKAEYLNREGKGLSILSKYKEGIKKWASTTPDNDFDILSAGLKDAEQSLSDIEDELRNNHYTGYARDLAKEMLDNSGYGEKWDYADDFFYNIADQYLNFSELDSEDFLQACKEELISSIDTIKALMSHNKSSKKSKSTSQEYIIIDTYDRER